MKIRIHLLILPVIFYFMEMHGNEQEKELKALFDAYYQALCVFATAYVNDDALAADIVQETFVKLWERQANFDNRYQIKSFLYITVRNSCLNAIRDEKRTMEELEALQSEAYFTQTLIEEEAYRIFYQAVESLPPQTRIVIDLSLDGLKIAEIAERMGIAESSVRTLKKIAYKKLRAKLKDYFYLVFIFLS